MCIYCGTNNYRKIYESHYGEIPKDDLGRTYHIHHIDGDHTNNDFVNLRAVSMQEHYDIHLSQGDYAACIRLARNLDKPQTEITEIARQNALAQIEKGNHNFLGPTINRKRIEAGTHNLLGKNNPVHKRVADGTHNFLGENNSVHKRVADGTHNFLGENNPVHKRVADGTHHFMGGTLQRANALKNNRQKIDSGVHNFLRNNPAKVLRTCPHCGHSGRGPNMFMHHFDRCIYKS